VTCGPDQDEGVIRWIQERARPLTDTDAPQALVGEATVVALGAPTHGARELTTISQQLLELTVHRLGFRALAMEENETAGSRIDDYLLTGIGDLQSLLGGLEADHRTGASRTPALDLRPRVHGGQAPALDWAGPWVATRWPVTGRQTGGARW
jgi:hypothetical protein